VRPLAQVRLVAVEVMEKASLGMAEHGRALDGTKFALVYPSILGSSS
jgi:hypothetical protein